MESSENSREFPGRNTVILETLNPNSSKGGNNTKSSVTENDDDDSGSNSQINNMINIPMKNKEVWDDSSKDPHKDTNKNIKSFTHQLLKKSSIRAVSKVGDAKTYSRKIMWCLVLAIGVTGCIYEVYLFLIQYFGYPMVINVNVEDKWSLGFPSVTVCSPNTEEKTSCVETRSAERCLGSHKVERNAKSCGPLNIIQDEQWRFNFKMLTKYSQMNFLELDEVGNQFQNLTRNCTFDGEMCSSDRFYYFQSTRHGNCFTFNKRYDDTTHVLNTSSVGSTSGLNLLIDFDLRTYAPSGMKVFIHHPNEDPNLEEEDVAISPGYETNVALKQTCFTRLPHPYKDRCVVYGHDRKTKGRNRYDCVKMYIQEHNYARCNCIDPNLPGIGSLRYCNSTDDDDSCCLRNTLSELATYGIPAQCPLPCFSTAYNLQQWSSTTMALQNICDLCNKKDNSKVYAQQTRLKVFYSSLERTVYEQKRMYQESDVFSQLGGQFGLWLGLSLVSTLFEILENVFDLVKFIIKLHCCKLN